MILRYVWEVGTLSHINHIINDRSLTYISIMVWIMVHIRFKGRTRSGMIAINFVLKLD